MKPSNAELQKAAIKLFKNCFRLKRGERVAIAVDSPSRIAIACEFAAQKLGGQIIGRVELDPARAHSSPIPAAKKLFSQADVVVAPTAKSISHSPETKLAKKRGTRFASMPSITEKLFVQAMKADFAKIRRDCARLKRILDKASQVRMAAKNGTEITLDVRGKRFECDDGALWQKGKLCNIPFGEVCTAPNSANGIIVPNSMRHSDGKRGKLFVTGGKLVSAEGGGKKFLSHLDKFGKCARVVGELGLGTNAAFKKSVGLILQDEKIAGSSHIAFGASCCYPDNKCGVHEDVVVEKVAVWADGKKLKL